MSALMGLFLSEDLLHVAAEGFCWGMRGGVALSPRLSSA